MTLNLKPYLISLTLAVVGGTFIINNRLSKIEEAIKVDDYQPVRKPASFIGDGNTRHQMRLGLEVISKTNIVPGNPEIKPPLRGKAYFCTTTDNVGYYVFLGDGELSNGDSFEGWFNDTGLNVYNREYDRNYSLITPLFIEKSKLRNFDSLVISP